MAAPPQSSPTLAGINGANLHVKGHRARLDAILDFLSLSSGFIPLSDYLDKAPEQIAQIFGVPVVSLYLLERGETLVMRANLGFCSSALGQVRMRVGEGLTGMAVVTRRPVTVAFGPSHAKFLGFPELHEERYPAFAAVPLLSNNQVLGALVIQREKKRFSPFDVDLLVALSASVSSAVRHAELVDALSESSGPRRRAGGGTRRVVLQGRPIIPGRVLGPLAAPRRPPRRAWNVAIDNPKAHLQEAFAIARRSLGMLMKRAKELPLGNEASFLETYSSMLSDGRFRERALELVDEGVGLTTALGTVAREAVRTATRFNDDAFLQDRARDMEDLCDALSMLAVSDPRAAIPSRTILVGDSLTVYDLLVTSRTRPVGIALTERADSARTRVLLHLLGLPSILDVSGLFRWSSDGDIALLDGIHGLLMINPSLAETVELRAALGRPSKGDNHEGKS